jgi:hypothetical protein
MHLSIVFELGNEMMIHLNNNNHLIATTLFILATIIIVVSSLANTTPVAATTTTGNATTTPSGIELSPQPIYQERITNQIETPINQTHMQITYSGNGMLTPPNTTETINTTSNGSLIVSFITQTAHGTETITTEDGNETATATFFDIVRFNPATGEGKGIVMAVVHTDSTGILAPLNGTIVAGTDDTKPEETVITLWEWEGGMTTTIQDSGVAATQEQESQMNTTTTADTTTTATEGEAE